ncbi:MULTISPECIES: class I lanthipeptide [unclassified Flavobacterium]|uniref:class I lanthipeptide n=1 Tax=unclassified Flavobacterium TaxID=196869 RepID=UPI0036217235
MKNKNLNQLAFNKSTLVELNDKNLVEVNGGGTTTHVCLIAASALSVGSLAVTMAFEFGLLEGAADAMATK